MICFIRRIKWTFSYAAMCFLIILLFNRVTLYSTRKQMTFHFYDAFICMHIRFCSSLISIHCKLRSFFSLQILLIQPHFRFNAHTPFYPSKRWMIFGCNYAASQFVRLHHFKWLAFTTTVIEFAIFPHLNQFNKVWFSPVETKRKTSFIDGSIKYVLIVTWIQGWFGEKMKLKMYFLNKDKIKCFLFSVEKVQFVMSITKKPRKGFYFSINGTLIGY